MTILDTSPVCSSPIRPFERIFNARDFSKIAPDHITPGVVIRSALPSFASPSDLIQLAALGVRQVIDLRSDEERQMIPGLSSLPDCSFVSVPMVVTPWNFEVLDDGESHEMFLANEYLKMMSNSGERICRVLDLIADFDGTTLVHCTAGKDRTGIIVALLAVVAAAPISNILADYERSALEMPLLLSLLQSALPAAVDETNPVSGPISFESEKRRQLFFNAPKVAMEGVLRSVFPFPHKYFDEIGFSPDSRRHLQSKLLLRRDVNSTNTTEKT
jgi:hypothetical protein